jgi:peptidyl-prolyl cis-trans isomerase-like 1
MDRDSVVLETSMGDVQLELYWVGPSSVSSHEHTLIHPARTTRPKCASSLRTRCPADAPQTCKNFAELAKRGYYSGTVFHRVIPVRAPPPSRTPGADRAAQGRTS